MDGVILGPWTHVRASANLNANTQGSTSLPKARKASEISRNLSGAILPRSSQLLTPDGPIPATEAAAVVPPRASTTASTVVSMRLYSSRNVKMSSLHASGVDFTRRELPEWGMPESNKLLAARLKSTREALDLVPAELCKRLKIGANAWSQYESGARRITIPVAIKFCNEYGLTLDWIYRADPSRLPYELRLRLPADVA